MGSLTASIIPRWYGARLVSHCPGSALDSLDSFRCRSAHSLIVSFGGGLNISASEDSNREAAGEIVERLVDRALEEAADITEILRCQEPR
jgi:hypothetical protein